MHDHVDVVEALGIAALALTDRQPAPPADRIALWLDIDAAYRGFGELVAELEAEATEAIAELSAGRKIDVDTPAGVAHLGGRRSTDRWHGHAIVGALAAKLVVPEDGEIVAAVPVDTIRAVVPGCATPDLTSSRWSYRAIAQLLDVDQFRERGACVDQIKRGPRP